MATTVALLVLYGIYDSSGVPKLSISVSAFYNATSRSAWALAICWVIVVCATGNGGKRELFKCDSFRIKMAPSITHHENIPI